MKETYIEICFVLKDVNEERNRELNEKISALAEKYGDGSFISIIQDEENGGLGDEAISEEKL